VFLNPFLLSTSGIGGWGMSGRHVGFDKLNENNG